MHDGWDRGEPIEFASPRSTSRRTDVCITIAVILGIVTLVTSGLVLMLHT